MTRRTMELALAVVFIVVMLDVGGRVVRLLATPPFHADVANAAGMNPFARQVAEAFTTTPQTRAATPSPEP